MFRLVKTKNLVGIVSLFVSVIQKKNTVVVDENYTIDILSEMFMYRQKRFLQTNERRFYPFIRLKNGH